MKFRALIALLTLAVCMNVAHAQKKKKPEPAARWMKSVLGPTFGSTINNVPKGIAIQVGNDKQAAFLFDEDTIRMHAAWTGGFVNIHPGRDALLGNDSAGGQIAISTPTMPGWSNGKDFADARTGSRKPAGPLPHGHARYKGLYMHGDKVVLKYTVGKGTVLEHPWAEDINGTTAFTRTFDISGLAEARQVVLADAKGGSADFTQSGNVISTKKGLHIALSGNAKGVKIEAGDNGTLVATIQPGNHHFKVTIATGNGSAIKSAATTNQVADVKALTKGGPGRWGEPLVTKGVLGRGKGAYVVDTLVPPFDNPFNSILHFGGHDFYSNGDIAICTMEGDVWRVRGVDDDLDEVSWQRIATGLYHPLGLKIVDDKVFVNCRDQLARLHDLNGDQEIDFYECFNNDVHVGTHRHEFSTCLETDKDGNFFMIKGTNGAQTMHDSSMLKITADGSKLIRYATGFRWPNGMGLGANGVLTSADQQGTWVPSSRLDIVKQDGFYGFLNSHHRETTPETYDGPLCWIPHWVDNSCGAQVWVESDKWGPLGGKMLHFSYGKCQLFLVLQESIDGTDQGGMVQMPIPNFQSGGMRGRFSPFDGQLYVSGLKGWQTSGVRDGCLQRVRYTGKKVYLPTGLNVTNKGVTVTFDQPLDQELAEDLESWSVERWNYRWTKGYGSKEFKVTEPDKVGHDTVNVKSAKLSADKKSVFVELESVIPVMQMSIGYDLESEDGDEIRGSIYNTVHKMGKD